MVADPARVTGAPCCLPGQVCCTGTGDIKPAVDLPICHGDLQETITMDDKRIRPYDRRRRIDTPEVPFRDSRGEIIKHDRRKTPDRRVNNIEVEWIDDEEDIA
jgi:hypothetical protein